MKKIILVLWIVLIGSSSISFANQMKEYFMFVDAVESLSSEKKIDGTIRVDDDDEKATSKKSTGKVDETPITILRKWKTFF